MDLGEMLRVDRCRDMGLTFEPDPDHSPDAGTGLLSAIAYALQRGILLGYVGNIRIRIGRASLLRCVVFSRIQNLLNFDIIYTSPEADTAAT